MPAIFEFKEGPLSLLIIWLLRLGEKKKKEQQQNPNFFVLTSFPAFFGLISKNVNLKQKYSCSVGDTKGILVLLSDINPQKWLEWSWRSILILKFHSFQWEDEEHTN